MPNSVRYYESTMSGAPSLSGTAGALIGVLDACLVNGFGSVTVNSLVVASDVATATVSAGHQFTMQGTTGPVIEISGANPSGLNGEWRVTVTSSTTFTFVTSGISDQTATGTISAKRAPAGFSKAFSGTGMEAYRSDDITGTRLYLRIDDTYGMYARIRGYEGMTDVNTGTFLFPTDAQISGGGYVWKSNAASSVTRPWALYTDGRMIYFVCDTQLNTFWAGGFVFGDVDSYAASDTFGCLLLCSGTATGSLGLHLLGNTSNAFWARSYTQLDSDPLVSRYSHGKTTYLGFGAQAYPAPADTHLHLWPVECWEGTTLARGMMPGLWNPIHDSDTPNGLIVDDIPNLPGRTLKVQTINNTAYECAIDLTGPWR